MAAWRVAVIGLGTVGGAVAKYLTLSPGVEVYGYDVVEKDLPAIHFSTSWRDLPHDVLDVYIVAVWTGVDEGLPDLSSLRDVLEMIASEGNSEALVSVESTVPPGTLRAEARRLGLHKVAHVPHRYWPGDPLRHGVRQPRVLGALGEGASAEALAFYTHVGIPVIPVEPIEVAEMSKVAENAYRFVQIAFAEELRVICEGLGLNFEAVRRAANTKWNVEILEAREGIGGPCLPKDLRYLIWAADAAGVEPILLPAAASADEAYRRWLGGDAYADDLGDNPGAQRGRRDIGVYRLSKADAGS